MRPFPSSLAHALPLQPAKRNLLKTGAGAWLVAASLNAYYSYTGEMNAKARQLRRAAQSSFDAVLCCAVLCCAVLCCAVLCLPHPTCHCLLLAS